MASEEYEYDVSGSSTAVAAAFEAVADGLRAGTVRVGDDEDAVTVATPDELASGVELEREDDEVSLEREDDEVSLEREDDEVSLEREDDEVSLEREVEWDGRRGRRQLARRVRRGGRC